MILVGIGPHARLSGMGSSLFVLLIAFSVLAPSPPLQEEISQDFKKALGQLRQAQSMADPAVLFFLGNTDDDGKFCHESETEARIVQALRGSYLQNALLPGIL